MRTPNSSEPWSYSRNRNIVGIYTGKYIPIPAVFLGFPVWGPHLRFKVYWFRAVGVYSSRLEFGILGAKP